MTNPKLRATGLIPGSHYQSDYYRSIMSQTLRQKGIKRFNFKRNFDYYQVKKLIINGFNTHLLVFNFNDLSESPYYRYLLFRYSLIKRVNIVEVKSGVETLSLENSPRLDAAFLISMDYLTDKDKLRHFMKRVWESNRLGSPSKI